jgi:hypothetical protein
MGKLLHVFGKNLYNSHFFRMPLFSWFFVVLRDSFVSLRVTLFKIKLHADPRRTTKNHEVWRKGECSEISSSEMVLLPVLF